MTVALWVISAIEFAGLVALGILLLLSRRALRTARRELQQRTAAEAAPRRRRKPVGIAPLAVRTVANTVQTADAILRRQIGGSVRSSIEDLAGWARVERPDLARITADGRVVLVFSDIEGSTERNASLGDREWVSLLDHHEKLVRRLVGGHRGVVVKNQGDGFMIAFTEPVDAVRCCIAVQQSLSDDERLDGVLVRMGVHAGTSVRRGEDLFGLDVATAARVADLADGGEILVSDAARQLITTADGIAFGESREVELKGLSGTQMVHPVRVDLAEGRPTSSPRRRP
ncbi:adenylate/guanylate cyclase domain-containing protein [Mycolicibacterium sp. F2034L]|uniref:adenylate/guanylate cyclase domain-containing protein n=1 Tax=Mycolicibacterium sp. F2034L TaxID=2926422 RepID=UPI001FF1E4D7|nr:adenylate/guanylate cyclase domain-containing protein [Mycolicibacterium sp. F2034L]MCK0174702.1 adenylate/guanylate cyclase domain-containing protein [Mycolicibacterium sp. F2034L]